MEMLLKEVCPELGAEVDNIWTHTESLGLEGLSAADQSLTAKLAWEVAVWLNLRQGGAVFVSTETHPDSVVSI